MCPDEIAARLAETPERFDAIEDAKDAAHARLLRRLEYEDATDCWVYVGQWQKTTGCGVLRVQGRRWAAHRVAAWVWLGGFALGDRRVKIRHRCRGMPACVNPEHLRVVR